MAEEDICSTDFVFHRDGEAVSIKEIQHYRIIPAKKGERLRVNRNGQAILVKEDGQIAGPNEEGKPIKNAFVIPERREYDFNLNELDEFKAHQHSDEFTLQEFIAAMILHVAEAEPKMFKCPSAKADYSDCGITLNNHIICTLINGISGSGPKMLLNEYREYHKIENAASNKATTGHEMHNNVPNTPILKNLKYILKLIEARDEKPHFGRIGPVESGPFNVGMNPFTLLIDSKNKADCEWVQCRLINESVRTGYNSAYFPLANTTLPSMYTKSLLDKYKFTMNEIQNPRIQIESCFTCGRVSYGHRHLSLDGAPTEEEINSVSVTEKNKGFLPLVRFLHFKVPEIYGEIKDPRYRCGGREEMLARIWAVYTVSEQANKRGLSLDITSRDPDILDWKDSAALLAENLAGDATVLEYIRGVIYTGKEKNLRAFNKNVPLELKSIKYNWTAKGYSVKSLPDFVVTPDVIRAKIAEIEVLGRPRAPPKGGRRTRRALKSTKKSRTKSQKRR